jgi:methylenetetrahydrofolate dehydrogenase (NADP+)/methenyltetrahydrofolate cyclohydrolase
VAQRIDGRAFAEEVRREIKEDVENWRSDGHPEPHLSVILVGDNPASASYVRGKRKAAREVGIDSETIRFEESISDRQLLRKIDELNAAPAVDGILVQLPLPDHIDESEVISRVTPEKDVDGFHPENVGRLMTGAPGFVPATPRGILELLRRSHIDTVGARAVIVGRSNIVGKPTAGLLLRRGTDATVTICHSRTRNLGDITTRADILISAVGSPEIITASMVRQGATVIDVGINRVDDPSRERGYRLVGDVAYDAVAARADAITPVPGGVGPMTIAMLLKNTFEAATGTYYSE